MHVLPDTARDAVADIVSRPHRSLGSLGLRVLLSVVIVLNVAGSVLFLSLGAWPVVGFLGLDVLAVWLALRISNAQTAAYERIVISPGHVEVIQCTRDGRQSRWQAPTYWTYARYEGEDDDGRVLLRANGKMIEIGVHLTRFERKEFAGEISQILHRARSLPPAAEA